MKTITFNAGDAVWSTVVAIDGQPTAVNYAEIIMDPATGESTMSLEFEGRIVYLRGQVTIAVTEVLADGAPIPPIPQRATVRQFVNDHMAALAPLAESVHQERANAYNGLPKLYDPIPNYLARGVPLLTDTEDGT